MDPRQPNPDFDGQHGADESKLRGGAKTQEGGAPRPKPHCASPLDEYEASRSNRYSPTRPPEPLKRTFRGKYMLR